MPKKPKKPKTRKPLTIAIHGEGVDIDATFDSPVVGAIIEQIAKAATKPEPPVPVPVPDIDLVKVMVELADRPTLEAALALIEAKLADQGPPGVDSEAPIAA